MSRASKRIPVARRSTAELEVLLETLDDSSDLYQQVSNELDQREHEHSTRISNGGVLS